MGFYRTVSARGAFLMSLLCSVAPVQALAADTVIGAGVTRTNGQVVTDSDSLTIEKGGRLDVGADAVVFETPSSATGVTIHNFGTIVSGTRAIDTDGDDTPLNITIINGEGASISSGNDTIRIDADVTDGKIVIVNDGMISSNTGQALDFSPVQSQDAVIDITNGRTGTITAADNDAIRIGGGTISIVNSGTISSVLSESRGIDIGEYLNVRSVLIDNKEGAVIEAHSDAIRIDSDDEDDTTATGTVVVNNAGLIVSRGVGEEGGQAIDFNNIGSDQGSIVINNFATGEIRSSDADAIRTGEGGVVNNWGTIYAGAPANTSGDPENDPSNDGIDMQEHAASVHNYAGGLISGARHGITSDVNVDVINDKGATIIGRNGSGVGSDGNGKVVNYGTIIGTIDDTSVNGDGDGVDIDFSADITNYGTIQGTGAKGEKDGSPNGSEGIAAGGGTIRNLGKDSLISGADNAILIDDSDAGNAFFATEIINEGTIRGSDGFGIRLIGVQDDVITNSGTIEAAVGPAIDMGDGDDTLNILTGSKIIGTVDGGAGSDTINLIGKGTFAGAVNFEFLTVSGNWFLTGEQSYTGGITLFDGSLKTDGVLDADMTVGAGSSIGGNGTFGSLTVAGTIVPGNSIGTITVLGNYVQTAGSVYGVEFNGTTSDLIDVTGTATIAGSVTATPYGAGATAAGRRYTILTATGGVTGTYTLTDPNVTAFIDGSLAYDANNVYLDMTRNAVTFASLGQTANQRAVATAIDGLGSGTVYDAVSSVTSANAAAVAFDSLSGEFHTSMKTALIEDSRFVRDAISTRLGNAFAGVNAAASNAGYGFWAQGIGNWGKNGGNGYGDIERSTGGLMLGVDGDFANNWRAGFMAGYSHSSYDADDLFARGNSDNYHIGAYVDGKLGGFGLQTGVAYSWHDIDTTRSISLPGLTEQLKADYDARTLQVFGEVNYDAKAGDVNLQPFANLAYAHLGENGFSETGGASALSAAGNNADATFTTIGLRASTDVSMGEVPANLRGGIAWRHAFGDINPSSDMSIAGAGFTVKGASIAKDAALIEAGIDFKVSDNATFGLGYAGQLADDASSHGAKANFKVKF